MKNNLPRNNKIKRELRKAKKKKNKALSILSNTIAFAALSSLVISVLGLYFVLRSHNGEAAKYLNLCKTVIVPMIRICTGITVSGLSIGTFSLITSSIKCDTLKDVM